MNRSKHVIGVIAIAAVLGFAAAVAQPRPASAFDRELCEARPTFCGTLEVGVGGRGAGTAQSESPIGTWDGALRCAYAAGAISGTCSHRYFVGTSRTVYLTLYPATGNDMACTNSGGCSGTSQAVSMAVVLAPNVNESISVAFEPIVGPPTAAPPTAAPPTPESTGPVISPVPTPQPTIAQPTPMPTVSRTKPPHGGGKPSKAPHVVVASDASVPTAPTPFASFLLLAMLVACGIGFVVAPTPRRR